MSESLPPIHEDREMRFAELGTRKAEAERKKAEAEAEKRKADWEILKIQERSGKVAVKATIGTDAMGFKTILKGAMASRG